MNREALHVVEAAVDVLAAVSIDKQLLGEAGIAEEATDDYREALILILLVWIAENSDILVLDELAMNAALDGLVAEFEALASSELPKAFQMGFGRKPTAGQVTVIGGALQSNSDFISGSLIPYIGGDLVDPDLAGLTLGDVAGQRALAWTTRVGLYAGSYWTSVWLGTQERLRDKLDIDTVPVRRLLDPRADHCGTCPGKAREYGSWSEMLGFTGGLPADGSDECFCVTTPNSRILTHRGWIPIQDVIVGDRVFTHRGRWRTVLDTVISMSRPTHRQAWIQAPNGEWIGCTTDHRWLTREGWRRTDTISEKRLSVYNVGYAENLRHLRSIHAEGSEKRHLHSMRGSLSLREKEELSGRRMSELRYVAESQTAMAGPEATRPNPHEYSQSWTQAQANLRRSSARAFLQQENGRPDLRSLLERRSQALNLSLSMDLDTGQRSDSTRDGSASCQSRPSRRSFGEFAALDGFGSQETSSPPEQPRGSSLRNLRQGILEMATQGTSQPFLFPELLSRSSSSDQPSGRISLPELWSSFLRSRSQGTPTKVLFSGMHLAGTPLYDLRVDEDHSFIVEGLISHNSNCRCVIELFIEGEWVGVA